MARDAKRFWVNACIEIYVPDQGYGEKATKNEELDAQWFANEIASQIPKAINKNFRFSERPYSVDDVMVGKIEKQKGVNMDYFTLSDLVQVLEDTLTYEEIEIFLSTEWGIA